MLRPDFFVADVDGIADQIQAAGRRIVTIDWFSGCGKSELAARLSRKLHIEHVALDDFLIVGMDFIGANSYAGRSNASRLARALKSDGRMIVEGSRLRDAMANLVARGDTTTLYLAVYSRRAQSLTWLDESMLLAGPPGNANWFERSEVAYHNRVSPHRYSDIVVGRIE